MRRLDENRMIEQNANKQERRRFIFPLPKLHSLCKAPGAIISGGTLCRYVNVWGFLLIIIIIINKNVLFLFFTELIYRI